jgi:polysaccharide export outer membrane protein
MIGPRTSFTSFFRALTLALSLVLATTILATPSRARADTLIQPGDTIRMAILGLPDSETDHIVDSDGNLSLGWFGGVRAGGRTIDEVLSDAKLQVAGKVYKRYTGDGLLKLIQLTGDDISLQIVAYRSIFVLGDVARPGEVQFRPGLTVRAAVAVVGGVRSSLLSDAVVADPLQIVRWQNEYVRATLDHATAAVRRWRAEAEIAGVETPEPMDPQRVAVSRDVLETLSAEQLQIAQTRHQTAEGDRAFLQTALAQSNERLTMLDGQRETLTEALNADEEEERRVAELVERSLVPANRLGEVRRNTLVSATRLLDLERALTDARLAVTRAEREIASYEETRMTELLTLREQFTAAMLEARLRMDLLSQNLSGSVQGEGAAGTEMSDLSVSARAYRRVDGEVQTVVLDLDSLVQPGDTIEVRLDDPVDVTPIQ